MYSKPILHHTEELDEEQFNHIHNLYVRDNRELIKNWKKTCIGICILICLLTGLIMLVSYLNPIEEVDKHLVEPLDPTTIFQMGVVSLIAILLFASLAFYTAYFKSLRKLKLDTIERLKVIECTKILEKKYLPHNNSYHFTLLSPTQRSLEVEVNEYQLYNIGDEINIEYAKNSKIPLGYY